MAIKETCCSKDKWELTFPSFSAVYIHTFAMDGDVRPGRMREVDECDYKDQFKAMKKALKPDPVKGKTPVSSLAEVAGKPIVRMLPDVEKLLFSPRCMNDGQVARFSMRGFDFRIPVRSDYEYDAMNIRHQDFEHLDFEGHVNVEVSQFFGNIFSVTYRFLFDGFTCRILEGEEANVTGAGIPGRPEAEAATNHLISLLSSCLGAEYWTGSDEDDDDDEGDDKVRKDDEGGIDLLNRLILKNFWIDADGRPIVRDAEGRIMDPAQDPGEDKDGYWSMADEDRVFDEVFLRYKKFLARAFVCPSISSMEVGRLSVSDDSRYAMIDIWETVRHPYGGFRKSDLFMQLTEAEIINHIRDYHKPELVGLMTMYPAEWPYRAAEAYDEVCGGNIAIDTDDLVLAGSHMAVVIGTYGRRGDGVNGVNWKKVMRDRRFYHVSWEEYLLILQFVLAKKYTFNHAVDMLLRLTDNMAGVDKMTIGKCARTALLASKKAVQLDVIKHMKFPSHKVMYDRTVRRLGLEDDFQRFKDVQEVVSGNLQSLGESHAAKADNMMNFGLAAISVFSLLELAFQNNEWPFVSHILNNGSVTSEGVASWVSAVAVALVVVVLTLGALCLMYKLIGWVRKGSSLLIDKIVEKWQSLKY